MALVLQMDMSNKHVKRWDLEFKGDEDVGIIFCWRYMDIFGITYS